jgi:antitoxin StbD
MNIAVSDLVNAIVPISRFNKGEAGKVFKEVNEAGIKIVLKNNVPACVLLSPDVYEELKETLEDCRLLLQAEKRMDKAQEDDFISAEEAMQRLGISEEDLKVTEPDVE